MRSYILTERERSLLNKYLNLGQTSDAFWVLLHRIKKDHVQLTNDMGLLQKAMMKHDSLKKPPRN